MAFQNHQPKQVKFGAAVEDPIRVVIVDDSAVVRGLAKQWLTTDPAFDVVASFRDGAKAVAGIGQIDCDVIILDIEMPEMDGLTALPLLVKAIPGVQVIMASTLTQRNASVSMKALTLGAADYIAKPDNTKGLTGGNVYKRELLEKVKALGTARRGSAKAVKAASAFGSSNKAATKPIALRKSVGAMPKVILIGSSTGGPQALDTVMRAINFDVPMPIFIVQHMPPMFTTILAQQITKISRFECTEAIDGELVKSGRVYLAPGDYHMTLVKDGNDVRIKLDQTEAVNFCRPAVDPLFLSAAEIYGRHAFGVVLTGMGHDGRDGSKLIVKKGGQIIAQDEATSVVWGMPGAVAEAGLANAVLPLSEVAPRIGRVLTGVRI